jgi:hypothetical protein
MSKVKQKREKEEEVTEVDEESIAIEDVVIPVKELPKAKERRRSPIYDRVLDRIMKSPKGSYRIDITWKNRKSIYQGLSKRIKTDQKLKILKLRMLGEELYIQKLE